MSPAAGIRIIGLGAVTPVGLSAPATCAALRAGIARMAGVESFLVDDENVDPVPVLGARVPMEWFSGGPVEEEWPGHERFKVPPPPPPHLLIPAGTARLTEVALPAVTEAWASAGLAAHPPQRLGLYLGLDAADDPQAVCAALLPALGRKPEVVVCETSGRAAALVALHRAASDLTAGRVFCALVGGVDSLLRPDVLERMEDAGQLKTDHDPSGIIPGEGAAFIVLSAAPGEQAPPLARLLGSGVAEEPTAGTDQGNEGAGLTRALRDARAAAGSLSARPLVVCDLNGDRYRAMEWGLANVRVLGDLKSPPGSDGNAEIWHPADCIGDSGAASGAIHLVWAATALHKTYAPTDRVLIWGASDGKSRAAAVLAAPGQA